MRPHEGKIKYRQAVGGGLWTEKQSVGSHYQVRAEEKGE